MRCYRDKSASASASTSAPLAIASGAEYSSGRWLTPSRHGMNSMTSLYVEDPDRLFAQAATMGAVVLRELRDEEYGGRGFMVADPEGNQWYVGSYRPGPHWTAKPHGRQRRALAAPPTTAQPAYGMRSRRT